MRTSSQARYFNTRHVQPIYQQQKQQQQPRHRVQRHSAPLPQPPSHENLGGLCSAIFSYFTRWLGHWISRVRGAQPILRQVLPHLLIVIVIVGNEQSTAPTTTPVDGGGNRAFKSVRLYSTTSKRPATPKGQQAGVGVGVGAGGLYKTQFSRFGENLSDGERSRSSFEGCFRAHYPTR